MVIATISISSFAQIGVQAGATIASSKYEDKTAGGLNITSDSKVGFTAGVFTEVPLTTNFIFRPALNYTQKGAKVDYSSGSYKVTGKSTYNYVELPLDIIYKAAGGFFVGLGPTLSYGIGGKEKSTVSGSPLPGQNGTTEEKVKFGNDKVEDHYKPFEFSGNFLAGYQLASGLFIMLNYNMGFSNISLDPDNESVKNRYIGIRIGKMLGAAKK
jgi:hypothetical protein